ncbi:MAG: dipeptidyl aminopeptidase/acylaminoacyl peptidase [Bacteroidetes bacterium]|nr:MAG: dipeptidyl aminopeptidase/acylaminoacyl peptidase [Bacteroidota bacterium]
MKYSARTAIFLLLVLSRAAFAQQAKTISLEDVWGPKPVFKPETVVGMNSMNDGIHYYAKTAEGDLGKYEYKSGKMVGTIFKAGDLVDTDGTRIDYTEFTLSPEEGKVMFSTQVEHIYRYSTIEFNYILDLKTKLLYPLSANGKQRLAAFSPDGKKAAFVRGNNIFTVDLNNWKEEQVTTDGEMNKIINGATDWVYEEEFTLKTGISWSPDSRKIAFYRFDESRVKEFVMPMYGSLYPSEYRYKYPKAGEENSVVSIHVYDLSTKKTTTVDAGPEKDQYIPRVKWTKDPNQLSLYRVNRLQNKGELLLADATTGQSKVILTETSPQYIEVYDHLTFLSDGKTFIWSSDRDGGVQLYHYGIDGKLIRQLTRGKFEVITYYGYDEKSKTIFYQSNEESVITRTVYSIKIDGSDKKKLSLRKGTNSAQFSTGMKYFINTWSDANTPGYISVHDATGKEIKMLKDNAKLQGQAKEYGFVKKEFFTFKNRAGTELNGWIMKPGMYNPDDPTAKYPVLMFVYGGPGRNTVSDEWSLSSDFYWYQMLCRMGYVIVSVDNRGTEHNGNDFKKCTHKQMGKLETEDQVDAAKYLGTLPFVDKDHIGIWGWSYGGYMSSMCLMKGADVFRMAMAIAPVSNWRYYDSIYTERYMGMPKDNGSGYDDNSPTGNVNGLRGKFFLAHGTGDDNVHFQNSVELVSALQKANKQFDFYMYPDKNHSIRGGNSKLHLYTKMTDFIRKNL